MESKKIIIVSDFFSPDITPRAFRTVELVKEFARRGHRVTLLIPNRERYRQNIPEIDGIEVIFSDSPLKRESSVPVRKRLRNYIPAWIRRTVFYFYNHEFFIRYDRGIEKILSRMDGHFDLLISVSYPVAIHRAVIKAFSRNKNISAAVKLAEFSDPPMTGESGRKFFAPYGKFMKKTGKFFDRFVIPVVEAMPCYLPYKEAENISIIPQGFDNSGIGIPEYVPNSVPTFAFAGRFYRITRDPSPMLEYLSGLDCDFTFYLFLIDRDPWIDETIRSYAVKSKGRIIVMDTLPRNELISHLATMDFIVNQNFTYSTATPSKLIDYALAARPVFSFSSTDFDPEIFARFLNGDYSCALLLPDTSRYDIRNVAAEFEKLMVQVR